MEKTPLRVFTTLMVMMLLGIAVAKGITYYEDKSVMAKNSENWGLGFSTKGQPPTANASPEELKKWDTYYIGDSSEKKIYLTFDSSYENGYTEAILDALKASDVKATFFLVGNYLETSPELVKRMVAEGHFVGNHTYHHPDMSKMTDKASFEKEIKDFENLYKEITGEECARFYRPPQGKYSQNNLKMAKDMGYKTFFWSLAYVDWYEDNQPTKEQAFDKLLSRIPPGAVVLLHSTSKTNSEILQELIVKWKEMGFSFGKLDEF